MDVETIVDAGPLIGWLDAGDQWHRWSVSAIGDRRLPLHTTEIVLGEVCWQLGGNSPAVHALLDLVRRHTIIIAHLWPAHLASSQEIMLKYPSMDAADASLVTLAELFPRAAVVTIDRRDFAPCRGLRNRALNLVMPR
ncbi:MAG TPA: PIN domain-containing protein [Chthoniobacterales bacterium]|jgi:predicted nucleic acid-binding protein